MDLGGFVFQGGVPFIHNDGGAAYGNTATGLRALASVTPMPHPTYPQYVSLGATNSAFGHRALGSTTTGYANTAVGAEALSQNSVGIWNVATGSRALDANTSGSGNTGIGYGALLWNEHGFENTAVGIFAAATSISGNVNTAVGSGAGGSWKTGSANVAIGFGAYGRFHESGVIRIGGYDNQSTTYIEGISATPVSGTQVRITADDQLGVVASSARFKQDIRDLDGVSERLTNLRPVSFRYKDNMAGTAANPIEYGLVAEEVAEVFPELVVNDNEGRPFTVRYDLLTPLLLGEVQRLEGELAVLRRRLEELERKPVALSYDP